MIPTRHGVQLRLESIPLSNELPYYALPEDYQGNQLKSYGGIFSYDIEYDGEGSPNDAPDIIIIGNGYTFVYRSENRIQVSIRNSVSVTFAPGNWWKDDGRLATREEIMMTLANVEKILVKLQYVDRVQRQVELLNVNMESAGSHDMGLGSASLVEECRCPVGYSGLSCEKCSQGYVRQQAGAWLGRCMAAESSCRPGMYGDPVRGIPCQQCPCPMTTSGNNFAKTCSLGSDGSIQCHCERGYTGRRCEACEPGYIGNPLQSGGSCQLKQISNCDPRGTRLSLANGRCECKEHVTGAKCDQCKAKSYYLNENSGTGCIPCFCRAVATTCTSSSWYRDSVRATFNTRRNEFSLITDYLRPENVASVEINTRNNEVSFQGNSNDLNVYYWKLPPIFNGDKVTSYGGYLNYTNRYNPWPGGIMSRNNAPDVVITSDNSVTIVHYRRSELAPSESQSYSVPVSESYWENNEGNLMLREHFLMAIANVTGIFIKATYTTTTDEAALSQVSLDTASPYNTGLNRAVEVEQCSCPLGYQGLSCENCAPGFTKTQGGNYIDFCDPCSCNGHSDECDPYSGECKNCRDNTAGENCEECLPGYVGNATTGNCILFDPSPITLCSQCDSRGYVSCNGECRCKVSNDFTRNYKILHERFQRILEVKKNYSRATARLIRSSSF